LGFLAVSWRDQGYHGRAKGLAERALALSRQVDERQAISAALYTLAQAGRVQERVRDLLEEGLELSTELGNDADVAHCFDGLAAVAAAEGMMVRAARP